MGMVYAGGRKADAARRDPRPTDEWEKEEERQTVKVGNPGPISPGLVRHAAVKTELGDAYVCICLSAYLTPTRLSRRRFGVGILVGEVCWGGGGEYLRAFPYYGSGADTHL